MRRNTHTLLTKRCSGRRILDHSGRWAGLIAPAASTPYWQIFLFELSPALVLCILIFTSESFRTLSKILATQARHSCPHLLHTPCSVLMSNRLLHCISQFACLFLGALIATMVLDSSRSDQLRGHQQARQLPIPDSEERISTASDVEPGSINHLTALGEKPGLAAEGKTQSRILRPASSGSDCATGWSFAPRPPFPKPRQIGRCTFIAGLQAKQPESHPHQDPVYSLGASHAQNE